MPNPATEAKRVALRNVLSEAQELRKGNAVEAAAIAKAKDGNTDKKGGTRKQKKVIKKPSLWGSGGRTLGG
eukprot:CAMPEP_0182432294 /NCGR_PEP_ID=MMETSP1167-20130531/55335_1 /TAXON_ID=2988 /ORGANISM="Mallomonas Sp, Strain CCMP3275" /LENGTH=70 /DNA_ID=CAMNT_0024619621 /DNA_START=24 /DNA_END=233 /DNA_ORIENTATION=+